MILLDSDHISVLLARGGERRARLMKRMREADNDAVGTTVITIEEQMRGWLAVLAREKNLRRQIPPYRELAALFEFFADFDIALFDDASVDRFEEMRRAKVRIGTMDLKIASIVLANDALLLTSNRKDFEKVPGLRFENWLD